MTFRNGEEKRFLKVFNESKNLIRNFEGCTHLKLFRDIKNANIFFTYSKWKNAEYLEKYRHSELFKNTWSRTKILFQLPAEAWSLDEAETVQ